MISVSGCKRLWKEAGLLDPGAVETSVVIAVVVITLPLAVVVYLYRVSALKNTAALENAYVKVTTEPLAEVVDDEDWVLVEEVADDAVDYTDVR